MQKINGKTKTIWLAGGGTGGHISPAISIYENLLIMGHRPVLITLERNQDYPSIKNIDNKNKRVVFYKASPIPKSIKSLILFLKDLKYSFQRLKNESKHIYPDAILAFGGYPVFPVLFWGLLHKIPFYLHEQNARHGVITRLFSVKAKKVFLSFPQKKYAPKEILTGNPLRNIFLRFKKHNKKSVSNKMNKGYRQILLLGGSQGATDINNLYMEICKSDFFKKDVITISTGKTDFDRIKKLGIKEGRKKDKIFAFIEDVPGAMDSNDIIVSRSGSGMIFEILWSQKPACFIPYPHAASDHQKYNSLALTGSGHYETIDLRPFDPATAIDAIIRFISQLDSKPKQKVTAKRKITDAIPLNAHEIITDILIKELA